MNDQVKPLEIEGRTAEGEVHIDAPPERVWQALTEAAELERWFPLEADVEPGEGGTIRLSWKNEYEGTCRILRWEPGRRLTTSWEWGEGDGDSESAAGSQVTDYVLEPADGGTHLRVVTSGFPDDPAWDDWVEGTVRGWKYELESLKHYLERQAGRDRSVVYLRRRVRLPAAEVWARLFGEEGFGARPLGGDPFDDTEPTQYAAVVEDPPGAMLRLSAEPCHLGVDAVDATVWLADWSGSEDRLRTLESEFSARLERLFPEGETV